MVGHADKAEANFTASTLLAAAQEKIVALEAEVATLKTAGADLDAKIVALTEDVATAKAATAAKETEVTHLKTELATAKGTANAVIASQGLAAETLPPLEPRASGSGEGEGDLTEQCLRAKAKEAARN